MAGFAEVGVDRGQVRTVPVTIQNKGLRALETYMRAQDGDSIAFGQAHQSLLARGAWGHALIARGRLLERAAAVSPMRFAVGFGVATALVLPWVSTEPAPFLYFQF